MNLNTKTALSFFSSLSLSQPYSLPLFFLYIFSLAFFFVVSSNFISLSNQGLVFGYHSRFSKQGWDRMFESPRYTFKKSLSLIALSLSFSLYFSLFKIWKEDDQSVVCRWISTASTLYSAIFHNIRKTFFYFYKGEYIILLGISSQYTLHHYFFLRIEKRLPWTIYCVSKKSCTILYSAHTMKIRQDFLDIYYRCVPKLINRTFSSTKSIFRILEKFIWLDQLHYRVFGVTTRCHLLPGRKRK